MTATFTIKRLLQSSVTLLSFSQVLLYLPLTLDIGGRRSLLLLSLFYAVLFGANAIWSLTLRNKLNSYLFYKLTSSLFTLLVIPALFLLTLNVVHDSDSTLDTVLSHWDTILNFLSPTFIIMEGLSTLLVIQYVTRHFSTQIGTDFHQLFSLLTSAITYVSSAWFLYEIFLNTHSLTPVTALLIGILVTALLFLTGISFAMHQGNVIETSTLLLYSVVQMHHIVTTIAQSQGEGVLSVQSFLHVLSGKDGHPPLPPALLRSFDATRDFIFQVFGAGLSFLSAAASALPIVVLIGLFYRLASLYAASRIILETKRRSTVMSTRSEEMGGERKRLTLKEEGAAARAMTILVAFSRLILIAVYTSLLLLSSSASPPSSSLSSSSSTTTGARAFSFGENNEIFWRWTNLFLMISLWAVEIIAGSRNTNDVRGIADVGSDGIGWKID